MLKENLIGYTQDRLEKLMSSIGFREFHGRQIFKWIYRNRVYEFGLMTDLPKALRDLLQSKYECRGLTMEHSAVSADSTRKFLFRLDDGHPVETVLIPDNGSERTTVCISSQVGCALKCSFCATGTMGYIRDLSIGEIVGQLLYLRDQYGEDSFTNVVMMGMGEPLHNFANVLESTKIISASNGLAFSAKKLTVSTSGISPKIKKLADSGVKVRLAISLHSAIQEKREKIMPVAQTFRLDKLMEAVRYFCDVTGSRVTFEYILFKGFNDSMDDVMALSKLVRGIPCKINIIAYNPVEGLGFERPTDEEVDWFGRQLYPRAPAVTVRKSRGIDIDAACGQLAARYRVRSNAHA